eukprot:COSAG01_NODE_858_length_13069_cov_23.641943_2_plen_192_part_00
MHHSTPTQWVAYYRNGCRQASSAETDVPHYRLLTVANSHVLMAHETTISRRCVCFAGTRNAKLLETYNATAADLEFGKLSSHRKKLIQFCISQNTQRIYHFSVAYAAAPTRGTNRNIIQVLPGDVHHNQGHQHEATGTGLPDWRAGSGVANAIQNVYASWPAHTIEDSGTTRVKKRSGVQGQYSSVLHRAF